MLIAGSTRAGLPAVVAAVVASLATTASAIAISIAISVATSALAPPAISSRRCTARWRPAESAATGSATETTAGTPTAKATTCPSRTTTEATTATGGTAALTTRTTGARTTEAPGSPRFALARLVDAKHPAVELLAVELLECLLRTFGRRHLDEGEAARSAGLAVHDDGHAGDLSAIRGERFSE